MISSSSSARKAATSRLMSAMPLLGTAHLPVNRLSRPPPPFLFAKSTTSTCQASS
jgi:hypothetical protein